MTTRSLAFMDESGILGGSTQRFFSLGLMKMQMTGPFSDAAHRVLDRAVSCIPGAGPGFEFKFNAVTSSSLPFHLELIDAFFGQPEYFFCGHIHEAAGASVEIGKTHARSVGKAGYLLELD